MSHHAQHHVRIRRRTRRRLVLLALFALLFQQIALASYACPQMNVQASSAAMNAHCADMPMADGPMADGPANGRARSPLCLQTCDHPMQAAQAAQLSSLPPIPLLAVLPVQFMESTVIAAGSSRTAHARRVERRTPGLAPLLEHRVLLI